MNYGSISRRHSNSQATQNNMDYGSSATAADNLMANGGGLKDEGQGVPVSSWLLQSPVEIVLLISVVLDAMAAGIIFIFSNTIMPALSTFNSNTGIQVMNTINDLIVNPLFLFVFMGGMISVYPTAAMMNKPDDYPAAARYYSLASTLIFFFGEVLVTVGCNVPRNDALMAVDPSSDAGDTYWRNTYLKSWVAWNTARGIFAAIASVAGAMALSFMGKRHGS
mmetsp:Transcript_36235/g.81461  ORF Transcript_36235/g.81461 Transcript_36235/m.81461 type:complete len:222 (-) Transcript_36235:186-851(-)